MTAMRINVELQQRDPLGKDPFDDLNLVAGRPPEILVVPSVETSDSSKFIIRWVWCSKNTSSPAIWSSPRILWRENSFWTRNTLRVSNQRSIFEYVVHSNLLYSTILFASLTTILSPNLFIIASYTLSSFLNCIPPFFRQRPSFLMMIGQFTSCTIPAFVSWI